MWAALKSDVIEFVVYEGFRDYYPKWFNDAIIDYITYDEDYECAILQSRDADPIVLVEGDVFLVNKHGDVWRMTTEEFEKDFYTVEDWFGHYTQYAVLIGKCIEVIVQDGSQNTDMMFLKNKQGAYYYISNCEFQTDFLVIESDD